MTALGTMRIRLKDRRKTAVLAAVVATMSIVFHAPAAPPLFSSLEGFATKTGFRGIFAWQAAQPVKALVTYGESPQTLDSGAIAVPGPPDSAGMVIADGLEVGKTYYWQVEDLLTGEKSQISSFTATNAYNDWDGTSYTLDLLVQLDSESLPPEVPWDQASENIAAGINVFAERLYDAMDGFARLGNVIITDTQTDYAGSVPGYEVPGCDSVPGAGGNLADVLVQTTAPFDSHTLLGWAIDDPCISFYVGRLGQLIVPWGQAVTEDLHFGYVATHEMMHYAFNAPDLYYPQDINDPRSSGCWNLDWDGSLMHNSGGWNGKRWELSELDRNPDLTPCDHSPSERYTWSELRTRYTSIPERPNGPIEHVVDSNARGNDDGGVLDIKILDRSGAGSTLTDFIPDDSNPDDAEDPNCKDPSAPVSTDPRGETFFGLTPAIPDLDLVSGSVKGLENGSELHIGAEVDDLGSSNPTSAPDILFRFDFTLGDIPFFVRAGRNAVGTVSFVLGSGSQTRNISGKFDADADVVSWTVPASTLTELGGSPALGARIEPGAISSRRAYNSTLSASGILMDSASSSCSFIIGQGTTLPPPPPPPPPPDVELDSSNLTYQWDGARSTNLERDPLFGVALFGCDGFEGPGCEEKRILVREPGLLEVSIEGENHPVNDFDLYLYDAKGKELDRSAVEGGMEAVSATVTPGIYTVSVHAWLTVDASYEGSAKLTLANTGAAPVPPSQASPQAPPSPSPSEQRRRPPSKRPDVQADTSNTFTPPPTQAQPSFDAPKTPAQAAPSELPTQGVSTTASLVAALAALICGLSLGFALARRH